MHRHPHFRAYLALSAVCLFWGTTYLGIRMSLESFPPLLLVCARYIVSGALMLAAILVRGIHIPRGRDLWAACLSGLLVLGIGNGCLVFAELSVPSGLACLILTISPFWMVGVEALLPGGEPLHLPSIVGMIVGLAGAALLFLPDVHTHTINTGFLSGFLILQLGMAGWSFGSIYQRRQVTPAHPIVIGAVQQLAAGLGFVPLTLIFREHPHKVIGNVYFVGTPDLGSYLITTSEGHILVNTDFETTVPQIRAGVENSASNSRTSRLFSAVTLTSIT